MHSRGTPAFTDGMMSGRELAFVFYDTATIGKHAGVDHVLQLAQCHSSKGGFRIALNLLLPTMDVGEQIDL